MLTTAQQATLKTTIEANATWMALPHNSDGASVIADELNLVATPDFTVWRTSVEEREFTDNVSDDATSWDWSSFISRSAGEHVGWSAMFKSGPINASKAAVRQGFQDIFSGGTGAGQRNHMEAIAKRKATVLEKLFATGTGTRNNPGTMEVEGDIGYREITTIMGW